MRPAASAWPYLAVVGLAGLSVVGAWREADASVLPIAQGSLPNLLAFPVLTFGFLMMAFPHRLPEAPEGAAEAQRRWFWRLWGFVLVALVAWEILQLHGNLVFDPLDLAATALGAALTVPVFRVFEGYTFRGGGAEVD